MATQLMRTNPSLTGNVQLYCYVSRNSISDICMGPLNESSYSNITSLNYGNSTYGKDVKSYYSSNSSDFYKPSITSQLSGNRRIVDTGLTSIFDKRVNFHEYGVKRVSKKIVGNDFSLFAPILIQSVDDIPDYAIFTLQSVSTGIESSDKTNPKFTKRINIASNTGNILYKYLYNSLSDLGELSTSIKMINVSPENRENYVIGRSVVSGNIEYIKSDLPIYLYYKDQTNIEFNSKIGNEYSRYSLISPYIFNIAWCFDLSTMFYNVPGFIVNGNSYTVNIDYYKNSEHIGYSDIDTNNEFIYNNIEMNFKYSDDETESVSESEVSTEDSNILNYNYEYAISSIKNNNRQRMIPYICNWVISNSNNEYLFNNCWGYENSNTLYGVNKIYGINFRTKTINSKINNTYWCDNNITNSISIYGDYSHTSEFTVEDVANKITAHGSSLDRTPIVDGYVLYKGIKYDTSLLEGNTVAGDLIDTSKITSSTTLSISYINIDSSSIVDEESSGVVVISKNSEGSYDYIDIVLFNKVDEWEGDLMEFINTDHNLKIIASNLRTAKLQLSIGTIGSSVATTYFDTYTITYCPINLYPCLIYPSTISVNNKVTSQYIEGSTEKELINSSDSIYINRYSGWISPRLFNLYNHSTSGSEYYINSKSNTNTDFNNLFMYEKFTTSDTGEDIFNCISMSNKDFDYGGICSEYSSYNKFPTSFNYYIENEYKWFFDSRIMYLEDNLSFTLTIDTVGSNNIYTKTKECLVSYYDIEDTLILNYIFNSYDIYVARVDNDTQYTIELSLK